MDIVAKWRSSLSSSHFVYFIYCGKVSIDKTLSSDRNNIFSIIVSSKLLGLYLILDLYLSGVKMYLKW